MSFAMAATMFLSGCGSSEPQTQSVTQEPVAQEEPAAVIETPELETNKNETLPDWSTEQKNAMATAKSYLNYSAFSHLSLVDQLEYEKYPSDIAVWAADNCNADWNQEALEAAISYVDYSGFSYNGLLDQLQHEGFTEEQAKYGADNCNADWDAEAVECAKDYLDFSSFSKEGLIDQLEYEGFTYEQALYAVEQNGF